MEKTADEMIRLQLQIAREALAELPQADRATCDRLRNQLALALDSIDVLVENHTHLSQPKVLAS